MKKIVIYYKPEHSKKGGEMRMYLIARYLTDT